MFNWEISSRLGFIDFAVLLASVILTIVIGLRASGKSKSVEAYLLGDRDIPWWAILGSIVATETSTATVLSVPGQAYGPTGMRFLQIAMGYMIGKVVVANLMLPLFFEGKLFSAYEVLQKRFGQPARTAASLLFLVTRNIGDGLRMFLAALVLQQLVGWPLAVSAAAMGGITIFYTYIGGMRSVIWNDCIQLVIYLLGAIVTVFVIVAAIPGGWDTLWEFSREHEKLSVFRFAPPDNQNFFWWLISDPFGFWAGLIGGTFFSLGTHGTDQMMIQRYLSARSQKDAACAILSSGVVILLQFSLFLFIGVQLACYYDSQPQVTFEKADEVYSHFIVNSFPKNTGLVGLMLAAIFAAAMSTLSSSLNSSASALLNDFYLPHSKRKLSPEKLLSLTRWLAVLFGLVQIGIGIWAGTFEETVINNAMTIAGYSSGLLLGIFGLGVLTRKVGQTSALSGAVVGLAVLLTVQFGLPLWGIKIAWPWFALIGSSTTFISGCAIEKLLGRGEQVAV